jgi:hypothetical protein
MVERKEKTFMKLVVVIVLLAAASWAQTPKNEPPAEYTVTPSCFGSADRETTHQCILRETARLFLLAGQRETALRILCTTTAAQEAFRPGGPLSEGRLPDNTEAIRSCFAASGIPVDPAKPAH